MDRALLVNLGNTHCRMALWDGTAVGQVQTVASDVVASGYRPWILLTTYPDLPLVGASVVPELRNRLDWGGRRITWLTVDNAPELDFSAMDASTLGADRIANALAASRLLPLPAIVVDGGTAITLTVVDTGNRVLGGAILPGRGLARQALNRGTGQLPRIELSDAPPAAIGTSTREAILAGVDLGVLGALNRLLRDTAKALGGRGLPAHVTGGDAAYLVANLDEAVAAPPNLTLEGLAIFARSLP